MIYLASTSARRKALLKKARLAFRAMHPPYVEKNDAGFSPEALSRRHALFKALSILPRVDRGTVVGADTVVLFKGRAMGKPRNLREAARMLAKLQGKWHTVFTAVAVLRVRNGAVQGRRLFGEKTRVRLKSMTPEEIRRYQRRIRPLDKAGAYAIQSAERGCIRGWRGSLSNAVGLPVEKLKKTLVVLR